MKTIKAEISVGVCQHLARTVRIVAALVSVSTEVYPASDTHKRPVQQRKCEESLDVYSLEDDLPFQPAVCY